VISIRAVAMPSLSVIIPVYNEPHWIGTVVEDLVSAVEQAPFSPVDLTIVDDGSDQATQDALAALTTPFPVNVIRQANAGRFAARQAGVEAVGGDLVLLLDSRVSIRPDALAFVARELERTGPLPIWTAHVDPDLRGNPYGRIWWVLESLAWSDYLANPRTMSYGLSDYDRYPKGTTCLLAPRKLLLEAIAQFSSHFDDSRDANDDTLVLRTMVAQQPINISPGFSCLYRPRKSLRSFARHAYHRGSVFVDGYGRPGARFFGVIAAFYPLSLAAALLAVARPRLGLRAAALAPLAGVGLGTALKRSRADSAAMGSVGPIWLLAYAAGMWRGLWLMMRGRVGRRG
jgi:glycosyltransferase involved in cell wall biosynthesis